MKALTRDEQFELLRTLGRAEPFDEHQFVAVALHILFNDLAEELADYYRQGLHHLGGSAAWLAERADELSGIPGLGVALMYQAGCPHCGGPDDVTRCPQCSIGRCSRCAVSHDGSALCRATREYADVHRQMRDDDEFDDSDFYFARRAMAPDYIRRTRQ